MNSGKYVFAQLIEFFPQKAFQRIVMRYQGDKYIKSLSCWNQLLIMMFGQLAGCESLRELVCIIAAHEPKSNHLGFGKTAITRSNLSKANANRDHKIFEGFAYKMISIAQSKRIKKKFEIAGRFYAFDSTTIDLCLSLFWWANFRKAKGGIKVHTLYGVVTQIPTFLHITEAKVHDMTNNFEIKAKHIALLYKNRWQVELFFKWIKQHLHIKSFWGVSENAVRIQIYTAITAYCLVAIVEHDLHLNRSTFDVLRILSMSLFDKTQIRELFERVETEESIPCEGHIQLCLNF